MSNSSNVKDSTILTEISSDQFYFFKVGQNYGIDESLVLEFMEENGITDIKSVINPLKEQLGNLSIIKEDDDSFEDLFYGCIPLGESINPLAAEDAVKGRTWFYTFIDKAAATITKTEYNEIDNIDKYINKCDKVLEDIKKEKEKVSKGEKDSRAEFAAMYLMKIAKTILSAILVPMLTKGITKAITKAIMPSELSNMIKSITSKTPKSVKNLKTASTVMTVAGNAIDIGINVKDIYFTAKDYNSILDRYENQILAVKRDLENKKKIAMDKSNHSSSIKESWLLEADEDLDSMMALDLNSDSEVTVHYQTYEDLRNDYTKPTEANPNEDKEVFHDDNPEADPYNVDIKRLNDNYYINHSDLKSYMDACGKTNYESAITDIIDSNFDSNLKMENTIVLMPKAYFDALDENTKYNIENSCVHFELHTND